MEFLYEEGKLARRILLLGLSMGSPSLPAIFHRLWSFPILPASGSSQALVADPLLGLFRDDLFRLSGCGL